MSVNNRLQISPSSTISFADVAHQTLIFDTNEETSRLILALLDTPWVQRLKRIRQTGNSHMVYMFAEHSRFGHSLGVAYLANRLMKNLAKTSPHIVRSHQNAVAAAALLHDIGHVAPGSHLAEKVWAPNGKAAHEDVSSRIILEDKTIRGILENFGKGLPEEVARILSEDPSQPKWTIDIISGGGWNADRGNWAIVDSAMCSVSYGRYNVFALLDAFRISPTGDLVLQESRLDALTHFFVARDSMYRQVYQHRVLQAVDSMTQKVVQRLRDIIDEHNLSGTQKIAAHFSSLKIYCDSTMVEALTSKHYATDLPLEHIFRMTESWWNYHLENWCNAEDKILSDLCTRLRDRRLLKTIRVDGATTRGFRKAISKLDQELINQAAAISKQMGFDPRYYVIPVESADKHRGKQETPPRILLDSGEIVDVTAVEPLIGKLMERPNFTRTWLAVPKEVKEKLGRVR